LCDDCTFGSYDPANDGADLDLDGQCDPCSLAQLCPDDGYLCLPQVDESSICACLLTSLGCACPPDIDGACGVGELCDSALGCVEGF
jgi:hypothetical protein